MTGHLMNQTGDTCCVDACESDPAPIPAVLPRFLHPEHGELEIYGFDGRSKLCRSVTTGEEYRIGTRVVNRLRGAGLRTLPLLTEPTLPEYVAERLARIPGELTREQIAQQVWKVADQYCRAVGVEAERVA